MPTIAKSPLSPFLHPSLAFMLLLGASACSSSKPDEPKELSSSSEKEALEISLDTPETALLANGKKYFNSGLYSLARQNFEALRTGYPLSQYVEFAEIKIADSLFEGGEYELASKAYEDFIRARPASEAYPYMLFRAARCHQLSHKGIGRDTAPLEKALELFNRSLSEHPDSAYAESARKYRSEVVADLAEHEKRIVRFYEKQNRTAAVTAREQMYKEKWVPVIKDTAYAGPQSEPEQVEEAPPPLTEETAVTSRGEVIPLQARILKIECTDSGARGVFVYFDRDVPLLSAYRSSQRLAVANGGIELKLPNIIAPEQTSNCFGEGDLVLSETGTIRVKSTSAGSAIALNNPPRLFISIPKN